MAEVLVLVEHAEGALKKVTAELITAARALGEPAAVVVGAPGTAASGSQPRVAGVEGTSFLTMAPRRPHADAAAGLWLRSMMPAAVW